MRITGDSKKPYEEMNPREKERNAIYLATLHAAFFRICKDAIPDDPKGIYLRLREHNQSCEGCLK